MEICAGPREEAELRHDLVYEGRITLPRTIYFSLFIHSWSNVHRLNFVNVHY